jgi:hypothetical protein
MRRNSHSYREVRIEKDGHIVWNENSIKGMVTVRRGWNFQGLTSSFSLGSTNGLFLPFVPCFKPRNLKT